MSTVLRVSGTYHLLQESLKQISFDFYEPTMAQRNRKEGKSSPLDSSTFNLVLSEQDGDHVPMQILECSAFLSAHWNSLKKLRGLPGVTELMLDFKWDFPKKSVLQFNRFPSDFLSKCAQLGIDLEISVYGIVPSEDC